MEPWVNIRGKHAQYRIFGAYVYMYMSVVYTSLWNIIMHNNNNYEDHVIHNVILIIEAMNLYHL